MTVTDSWFKRQQMDDGITWVLNLTSTTSCAAMCGTCRAASAT